MPYTREPLEYRYTRWLAFVGMELETWVRGMGPIPPEERPALEAQLAKHLELETAQLEGMIERWKWRWSRDGILIALRIYQGGLGMWRQQAGVLRIKQLLFQGSTQYSGINGWKPLGW